MTKTVCRALLIGLLTLSSLTACSKNLSPAGVIAKAHELIDSGKSGEARIALKNLVDAHPEASAAYALLAQIELDSGSPQNAELELAKIPASSFNDLESQTVRLRTMIALGKNAEVLAQLDANTDRLIGVSQRAVLRAQALRGLGRAPEALQVLRSALAADANNPALELEAASTLAALGNLAQAIHELDGLISGAPKPDADLLRARGEFQLRAGAADKAIADLQAALKAASPAWPLLSRFGTQLALGNAQLAGGHVDEAKAQIVELKKLAPKAFPVAWLTGRVAMAEGKYGDAVDSLQKVAETLPNDTGVHYMLIEALLRSGNIVRATGELEQLVKANPADLRARQALAQVSLQQNRPDRVVELLGDASVELPKNDAAIDGLLATARDARERAGKAIATLTAQLAKTPADQKVRTQLAAAHLLSGDANRAIRVLQEAVPPLTSADAVGVEFAARLAQGNDRETNALVKSLLDSDSVAIDSLLAAADAAQRSGRADLSRSFVERAMQREAANPGALLRRANLEFSEQHYDAAKNALDALLVKQPLNADARMALARVLEAKGDLDGARAEMQRVLKAAPALAQASVMLISLELRAGKMAAANSVADAAIAAAPVADGRVANAVGMLFLATKHADEARARFRKAIDQQPENAEYWFNLGRSQVVLQDREAARESFAAAVSKRPEWLEANLAAIQLSADLGHAEDARRLADALATRMPGNAAAWAVVGDLARREKRYDDARTAFARSFALQPSAAVAISEFTVRVAAGAADAEQPLVSWLARQPNDLNVRRQLAEYYLQRGNSKAAMAQFELVLKSAPNDLPALNNLAWLLVSSDPKRAEALARSAVAIDPQAPAIADTLGAALLEQKRYPEARKVLERAAKGMAKDPSVQYRYALALARSGDSNTARSILAPIVAATTAFPELERAKQLAQELGQ